MTKTEVKKELYKQKPIAEFNYDYEGHSYYSAEIIVDGEEQEIKFKIPFEESGDFNAKIESQLLIRWLYI